MTEAIKNTFINMANDGRNIKIIKSQNIWITRPIDLEDVNISDIGTILVHDAGRWCESYASDVFIGYDMLREKIKRHIETLDIIEDDEEIFGFRRSGVDHDAYVYSHLINGENIDGYYSKLYMIKISDTQSENDTKTVTIELIDIMTQVSLMSFHRR